MDPRDYQLLATELLIGNPPSRKVRTAVGRAYYAVLHVGSALLTRLGFRVDTGPRRHKYVSHRFNNSSHADIQRVGQQLEDLYSRRLDADYELSNTAIESQVNARTLVEQARIMIETIDRCSSEPHLSQIKKGIHEYEKKISFS